MKTEKLNLLEQRHFLPCSRVVNGFRLCPFFTKTKFVCWAVRPNKSSHIFAFDSLESAESFVKNYSNNHSEAFWHKRFSSEYLLFCVTAPHDGYLVSSALSSPVYCTFINAAVSIALQQ